MIPRDVIIIAIILATMLEITVHIAYFSGLLYPHMLAKYHAIPASVSNPRIKPSITISPQVTPYSA